MSTFNFQKNSGGYIPGLSLKGEGRGEGEEREGTREGRPPIHIPGYATGHIDAGTVADMAATMKTENTRPYL